MQVGQVVKLALADSLLASVNEGLLNHLDTLDERVEQRDTSLHLCTRLHLKGIDTQIGQFQIGQFERH